MDSLNNLANSLPPSNLANAEKELTNNFKSAALALTTLYRSSRRTSKRAYNAGYATACQDLLLMIQQGVSTGESTDSDGPGMTIGRIMDYIEARLDAIKSREEEEDEDEEKDRERDRAKPAAGPSAPARVVSLPAAAPPRHKDLTRAGLARSANLRVQGAFLIGSIARPCRCDAHPGAPIKDLGSGESFPFGHLSDPLRKG
ncbi:hypothetical protein POSPLADRAFT_1158251 [Postia placenta MAD-698-R-SB12]|uniref:Uncharacterized protein n=1 Tax=Postia placenta MAD-698-R-SB12 TaxID=670580 RepID=A0A1X6MKW0_9APHY|nr:hypothetical protein POSPLADRAFT_1158251 [Postia placenta MAD-698-R-SB12]OSX56876.1 hypothetical protein POSPLADRAFT_1158251 [Postia placenta MAD-698-R-SB12]